LLCPNVRTTAASVLVSLCGSVIAIEAFDRVMRYGSRRTVVAFRATTAVRFPLWANQSLKPQVPTHIPQGISTSGRATGAVHSGFRMLLLGSFCCRGKRQSRGGPCLSQGLERGPLFVIELAFFKGRRPDRARRLLRHPGPRRRCDNCVPGFTFIHNRKSCDAGHSQIPRKD